MTFAGSHFDQHHHHQQQQLDAEGTSAPYFEGSDQISLQISSTEGNMMQLPDDSQLHGRPNSSVLSPAHPHNWGSAFPGTLTAQIVPLAETPGHYNESPSVAAHMERQQSHHPSWAQPPAQYFPAAGLAYDRPPPQMFERPTFMPQPYIDQAPPRDMGQPMSPTVPMSSFGATPDSMYSEDAETGSPSLSQTQQSQPASGSGQLHSARRSGQPSTPRVLKAKITSRSDVIRKKNARIEIPPWVTLDNIDEEIATAKDQADVRRKKGWKRVLRNRVAALESRKRRKQRLNALEEQEKHWHHITTELQEEKEAMGSQNKDLAAQDQALREQLAAAQEEVQTLQEEKRAIALEHQEELARLRKRLRYLEEAPTMSRDASSTGYAEFNAGIESLTVGEHEWDNLLVPDFSEAASDVFGDDNNNNDEKPTISRALPAGASRASTIAPDSPLEAVATPGMLFFFLLCGAFVASRPGSTASSSMLRFPEEVRAAAPSVLNTLISDPGPPINPTGSKEPQASPFALRPSSSRTQQLAPRGTGLENIHQAFAAASRAQQADNAFGLSSSQFSSLAEMPSTSPIWSGVDDDYPDEDFTQFRPNLTAPIAYMQEACIRAPKNEHQHEPGGADSTAKGVEGGQLWGQVPADIIEHFKLMIKDEEDLNGILRDTPKPRQQSAFALPPGQQQHPQQPQVQSMIGVGQDFGQGSSLQHHHSSVLVEPGVFDEDLYES